MYHKIQVLNKACDFMNAPQFIPSSDTCKAVKTYVTLSDDQNFNFGFSHHSQMKTSTVHSLGGQGHTLEQSTQTALMAV